MKSKTKRHVSGPRPLYFLERFLYWGAWLGVMTTLFFALREGGEMRAITLRSGIEVQTFYNLYWMPLITVIIGFAVGAIPTGLAFLIGRLLSGRLHLEEENTEQEELIQTLVRERDEALMSQRLIEQDVSAQDLSEEDRYEQLSMHR